MQDVQGSACFEHRETEFRHSRCIRQGGVEAPVLWGRVARYVLWKAEEKRQRTGSHFRRRRRQPVRAARHDVVGQYWVFCDNRVRLVSMVNDIIEELLDLDMEPKMSRYGGQALIRPRRKRHRR